MRIEFYCETLSFWVILVNIWWFWVIFRWSIFDDLWCFFVSSRSLCHGFMMDSHLTARLKASLDMVSTAIPWLQPRPSLRSQQKVNSKGTWKNGCFGILIHVTRFHLLGHFRFPFSAKMWVFFWGGGRVCIFEPSQIDGKIQKKKKNKSTFLRNPGLNRFHLKRKSVGSAKKPRNSGWFGQGHRLSLPPLVNQRLQLPTNKGQMVRIWLHEQRPHETSRPTLGYEMFLRKVYLFGEVACWSCHHVAWTVVKVHPN